MTGLLAAAPVGGLSTGEAFLFLAAACFLSAVAASTATAMWMNRRWADEVTAEWADGMDEAEPDPGPLAPVYRLPARYQHGQPDLRAGLHNGRRCD
jgi:hypothetical protein